MNAADATLAALPPYRWKTLALAGLVAGIIATLIAAPTMLALSNYLFYSKPHVGEVVGSPLENYTSDLPSALYLAAVWYIPLAVLVFPLVLKVLGISNRTSLAQLVIIVVAAAALWWSLAAFGYWLYGLFLHVDMAERRDDWLTAALSGALFGVLYDSALRVLRR